MADLKKFAEQLVNLTVKEVNELADILKDEYGIEPAAAAVAFVQKHIIAKLKVELKDIDDELKVAPRILDNLDAFIKRTRKKIQREKARYEAKKRIMEENKKMLS